MCTTALGHCTALHLNVTFHKFSLSPFSLSLDPYRSTDVHCFTVLHYFTLLCALLYKNLGIAPGLWAWD